MLAIPVKHVRVVFNKLTNGSRFVRFDQYKKTQTTVAAVFNVTRLLRLFVF